MEKKEINFSTSIIELRLKEALSARKDLKDRILTSDELGEYFEWAISNYGKRSHLSEKDLSQIPCSDNLNQIAIDLLSNPSNAKAKNELLKVYGPQSEENFFVPGIDISAARQVRFMPSHWHSNDYFEFFYNMGESRINVSFPEENVELKKGSILLVSPGTAHASQSLKEDDNLLFYMIRKSTFKEVFWNQLPKDSLMEKFFRQIIEGGKPTSYLLFETNEDEEIREILTQIYFEGQLDYPYKGKMLNSLMSTFFILLLRNHEDSVKLPRSKDFYWNKKFSALIGYIETNYANVSLSFLSKKFNYSEKQISRIVYKYIGTSYNQLVLELKMKRAAFLLNSEALSIDSIASMVGYSTTSSFYRAFNSYYGQTPLEYRKSNKNTPA